MISVKDLLTAWQEGIEKAQTSTASSFKNQDLDQDQLYEAAGLQVHSGIVAGQLFSLLTICRCED